MAEKEKEGGEEEKKKNVAKREKVQCNFKILLIFVTDTFYVSYHLRRILFNSYAVFGFCSKEPKIHNKPFWRKSTKVLSFRFFENGIYSE